MSSGSMCSSFPQQKKNYMAELNQRLPTFLGYGAEFLAHVHIILPVHAKFPLHPSTPNLQLDTL